MPDTPNRFSIRAGVFHGPASLLSKDPNQFHRTLQKLDLPSDAEEIIETEAYFKGIDSVTRLAEDQDFFLRVSLEQNLEELGVYGRAIVAAETLWDALQIAQTALRYYQNNSELFIRTYHGRCRIWYITSLTESEGWQDIQYTMGLLATVVFQANAQVDPEITLSYPRASAAHFNGNDTIASIRESSQGHISFHESLLKAKMRCSDSVSGSILSRYLQGKTVLQGPSLARSDLVAGLVKASFGVAPWSLEDTARVLGIGPRSLQIQLRDEGTNFRKILNSQRHAEARRLLADGESIESTADVIGFEHRQSFSEAFTQWEGCPPSKYRLALALN